MSDTSLRTETRDAASPAELARHLAGAPFIYGLAAPLALLDVCVSLYQAVCFRLWDVPRVRRRRGTGRSKPIRCPSGIVSST